MKHRGCVFTPGFDSSWLACHDDPSVSSPAAGINEQQLFHGTSAAAAAAITQEGFDFRLNSNSTYGVGNYFSDSSYTALLYSKTREAPAGSGRSNSSTGTLTLLVARVLLGRQCEGKHGLKRAPDGFDSVTTTQQLTVPGSYHVVFDNSSAYPDHVITLQR
jgi:hypothetical protein